MRLYVAGIGLSGPGFSDWVSALSILRGESAYRPEPYQFSGRSPLAGPERRRATAMTQLALEVAMEAAGPDRALWDVPTVFASSGGEVDTCHVLFDQLARPERSVSPTQFHNSVHNAASGYWGIASGSHQPSVSLAGFDTTFAAGLMEAAGLLREGSREVLLIAYDGPPPFPIGPFRPLVAPFAVAIRLCAESGRFAQAGLDIVFDGMASREPTPMTDPELEVLRRGNPAARALPLLAALARERPATVVLEFTGSGCLEIELAPCR